MRLVRTLFRWLCVPLVFLLVLAAGVFAGVGVVRFLDTRCAADAMAGGVCVASWHTTGIEWVVYAGLLVTVVLAVLLSARVAPFARFPVAVASGVITVAVPAVIWLGLDWSEFRLVSLESLLAAASAAWLVRRRGIDVETGLKNRGSV